MLNARNLSAQPLNAITPGSLFIMREGGESRIALRIDSEGKVDSPALLFSPDGATRYVGFQVRPQCLVLGHATCMVDDVLAGTSFPAGAVVGNLCVGSNMVALMATHEDTTFWVDIHAGKLCAPPEGWYATKWRLGVTRADGEFHELVRRT